MESLGGAEFAPESTYLNTSTCGLLPARSVAAATELMRQLVAGRPGGAGDYEPLAAVRHSFAQIAQVDEERVALGGSVSVHTGLIANSLPTGAEVLIPEGEFVSVVTPFVVRGDLKPRFVPLDGLADAVGPETALVAFSAVQSADGRIADLSAVREAAARHGARTLVDASQSAGWLPLRAGDWDYTVTGGFKFLLCPRGVSFLTLTEEAQNEVAPIHAGGFAAADLSDAPYGPVKHLAPSARRYDEPPAYLAYHAAQRSLELIEEIGVPAIHKHATDLAHRFREGLTTLGHPSIPGDSAIVAIPGLGHLEPELARAGVLVAERAGNLRVAFHLYNSVGDVESVLSLLRRLR
ncbi:aminotransferase class V-fold PLP-dependent enzyme [Streptomyces albipurpureus]|uniref:Aminotransferase class V-fold PLP-dependent enzyme n=1 Tax=Streptomyces albipurpureus TaxID=2897419 RepID=A0ABT0USC9_9ACTN|nr:aminotransferase class V-fold PLP-dependent enzyme [Streptomyces sp. CWNU-1]MCM2391512.1 aminotransferase class V-fold PLP-dependent enzyme [Streptomyces sp. CWNU-1]